MGNTKSIGIAYSDQDLTGATLTNCTITGSANATVANFTANGNVALGDATTDTLAFYGNATPRAQQSSSNQAAVATTAPATISATQWGYSTSTQAAALVTLTNEIRNVLVNLGLMKGS